MVVERKSKQKHRGTINKNASNHRKMTNIHLFWKIFFNRNQKQMLTNLIDSRYSEFYVILIYYNIT